MLGKCARLDAAPVLLARCRQIRGRWLRFARRIVVRQSEPLGRRGSSLGTRPAAEGSEECGDEPNGSLRSWEGALPMADLIFVAVIASFFALMLGFVEGLEHL
jgi:hypothetical protein